MDSDPIWYPLNSTELANIFQEATGRNRPWAKMLGESLNLPVRQDYIPLKGYQNFVSFPNEQTRILFRLKYG